MIAKWWPLFTKPFRGVAGAETLRLHLGIEIGEERDVEDEDAQERRQQANSIELRIATEMNCD